MADLKVSDGMPQLAGSSAMPGIEAFLSRPQPCADAEAYAPGKETVDWLRNSCKVLVIGAGGLGCELLKDLVLSGFGDIHVVDMDNIDITNLNRQFLFREKDVGRSKAEVAAEVISSRFAIFGVKVTPHVKKIQDFSIDFYSQFNIVIGGLDNIEARRWINSCLHSMVRRDPQTGAVDVSTIKPLLDGGTEGFRGQARVIIPSMTSCFECSLDTFPEQVNFPLCTIAETPRMPEHCIEYAMLIEWEKAHGNRKWDSDNADDMSWLYETAKERAAAFGIEGVTYHLTLGVVKRIVPAVASSNALVSAALATEAFKIATYCAPPLNNYMMVMGNEGVYTYSFEYSKKEDCLVCGERKIVRVDMASSATLQDLLDRLAESDVMLKRPSITSKSVLFMQSPPQLRKMHEPRLKQSLASLVTDNLFAEGQECVVTDPAIENEMRLVVTFVN